MRPEVDELVAFYQGREGQLARRLVAARLRALWPDVAGQRLVGLGYAAPYLPLFGEALRCVALMPAAQGARAWPAVGASRTALVREDELPLADGSVDRVLLVHALELSERVDRVLREVWRVLADGGRLRAHRFHVPDRVAVGCSPWCPTGTAPGACSSAPPSATASPIPAVSWSGSWRVDCSSQSPRSAPSTCHRPGPTCCSRRRSRSSGSDCASPRSCLGW